MILSFLREQGGEETRKVLEATSKQHTSPSQGGCFSTGATIWAQGVARGATPSRPLKASIKRVGRELLGKGKGEKRGFGPLDNWVTSKGSGTEDLGRVEKEEDSSKERNIPSPVVRQLRDRFEKGGCRPL